MAELSSNDKNPIDFLVQIKTQLPDGYQIPDIGMVSTINKFI